MKNPQVRFQRKTVIGLILIVIVSGFLLSKIAPVHSAPQATKRLFENKIPVHVPLGIKLKEGKEAKVQNLSNKNWFRDLEIEITNNSEKPIYFFSLYVEMPDVKNYVGAVMMFPVWFGRGEFTNFDTKPLPDDVPLQPKETYTYTVSEKRSIAWERWLAINQKDDATRLELIFGQLSFGDGTGFVTTGAVPFPFQTNPGELGQCVEKPRPPTLRWGLAVFSDSYVNEHKNTGLCAGEIFSETLLPLTFHPPPIFAVLVQVAIR